MVEKEADGVRVIRVPAAVTMASQPLSWRYFWLLHREGCRADIVHLHAPNMLAALASLILPKGTPLVVHWHSDVVGKGLLSRLLRPLEKLMLQRANVVIATSPSYMAASLPLTQVRDKVHVIPLGVPDAAAKSIESQAVIPSLLQQWLAGRPFVSAVGRLVPYKGFVHLVEAAQFLSKNVAVVIVGDGPLHHELQMRITAAGLGDRVILAGRQDDWALSALFKSATLFCLPSVERSEAFGVVLIEAMSWRLPVVATNITGSGVSWVNQEGESGLNVKPSDPFAIANACNRILSCSSLRERLAKGARQRFESEFSEAISVHRTNQLHNNLIN
jgi:glycosyltransferase involved in cell wall biosynthesis